MFKIGKSIATEGRLVVASGWLEGRMGIDYLMDMGFPVGVIKFYS